MDTIDKKSSAFVQAMDAEVQRINGDMVEPSQRSIDLGVTKVRRKNTDEITYFLKANTLSVLERLHNIATDSLYSRDENGKKIRISVPPGVQLQAGIAFLDRAMGKPQVNVDLTSGQRPISFDGAFASPPLIVPHSSIETAEAIESIDTED